MLGTKEQRTEGMKRQANELIEQAYNRGYKAGYDKAFATLNENWQLVTSEAEEKGRNEAWEAAKKIYLTTKDGGLPNDEIVKIFDVGWAGWISTIFKNFSASEVVEKLSAYEGRKRQEEDNEISVGDEVAFPDGEKFIVVGLSKGGDTFDGLYVSGAGADTGLDKSRVTKTGRTFPQIVEVLNKMQEEKNV